MDMARECARWIPTRVFLLSAIVAPLSSIASRISVFPLIYSSIVSKLALIVSLRIIRLGTFAMADVDIKVDSGVQCGGHAIYHVHRLYTFTFRETYITRVGTYTYVHTCYSMRIL